MFSALKKMLGIRTTNLSSEFAEISLFSGSAYFSNRVPKAFTEKWVAHGGEISSGTIFDVRARYFFATDPSDPWVTKLFAKSVMVIHVGWIVHCVDEAFQVPIAEYILDDRFIPGPPYKLTDIVPSMSVPLSEPGGSTDTDTESGESGPTPIQTSDIPSTPTSMRRKRKREQAYFDSPSGSFVSSGFDKDGMPRRPRKQRKLRFNPSFSPEGVRSGRETKQGSGLDWLWDPQYTSRDDDDTGDEHSQHPVAGTLRNPSHMTTVRLPDTPDKPPACGTPSATYRRLSVDEHLSNPTRVPFPAIPIDLQEKIPPIRTIDFTNLLPPTRRWRFPQADAANSGDMDTTLSVVKSTNEKAKTPKKISFANQAQVCVYMVSPRRTDAQDSAGAGPARQCLREGLEDEPEANCETRMSSDEVKGSDDSTTEAIKTFAPQTNSPKINSDLSRLLVEDQFENDPLVMTMEEVQAMRHRLLESAAKIGTDNGQLATLFELGKTFRGMTFRHVW